MLGFGRETANDTTGNDTAASSMVAGIDRFTVYPTIAYFTGMVSITRRTVLTTSLPRPRQGPILPRSSIRPATILTPRGPVTPRSKVRFQSTSRWLLITRTRFVAAANVSGTDRAIYYDSPGTDVYYALQYYSLIYGTGYYHQAVGFDSSVAYATAGGFDYGVLFDSTGNDTVTANSVQMQFVTPFGITYSAVGFDQATALSSFGGV